MASNGTSSESETLHPPFYEDRGDDLGPARKLRKRSRVERNHSRQDNQGSP